MQVLFIADVPVENPSSGAEQVLNQEAVGLAGKGFEICAITRHSAHPAWVVRDVHGVKEASYQASIGEGLRALHALFKYPPQFYRYFTENRPFHGAVCHQPFTCFSLRAWGKLQNLPYLYVFHSPSHEEYRLAHEGEGGIKTLAHIYLRRIVERVIVRRAHQVITLSRYMKKRVVKIHGIPLNRVTVNPGGVDLNRFKPPADRQAQKKKLGFPDRAVHLLTVRNLEPRMGLDNLLRAMHFLREGDVHLIMGGEGPEKEALKGLVNHLGLSHNVTLTGFIPSDLLPTYYGAADFFILPTRRLEGFGLVTPEAMACGTPVLGTPVGGTKEILSEFDPAFLFQDSSPESMTRGIKKALKQIPPSTERYKALRTKCRLFAERTYSWTRHVDQLESRLNEMLSFPPRSSG